MSPIDACVCVLKKGTNEYEGSSPSIRRISARCGLCVCATTHPPINPWGPVALTLTLPTLTI